jgi:hypothetical protein
MPTKTDTRIPDLIDRYLHAVGKHLPASRREDILAELSANLLAEVDDKEAELGRPPTPAELSALLKTHGRPFLVAANYRPQQYLIGPVVFPWYMHILKIALAISAVVNLMANAIMLGVHGVTTDGVLGIFGRLPFALVDTAGWITVVFIALEWAITRYPAVSPVHTAWKPESLPPVTRQSPSRLKAVVDLLVHLAGVLWLAAVPRFPFLVLGPGARYFSDSRVQATPAAQSLYWQIIALLLVPVAIKAVLLVRSLKKGPLIRKTRILIEAFNHSIGVVILALAIRVHDYFAVTGTGSNLEGYRRAVDAYNSIAHISIGAGLGISIVILCWTLGKYFLAPGSAATSRTLKQA